MSDKLGPAARKQKINTFKLLKVMHKYLSAIHAGSSRERLRVQIPLVYNFLVLFASFYVKKPSTERNFFYVVSNIKTISADNVKRDA